MSTVAKHKLFVFVTVSFWVMISPVRIHAKEGPDSVSSEARWALQLIESDDPYEQQLGFLRLEALREPATVKVIQPYVEHQKADYRAYSLRAMAAIKGALAVPLLLEKLESDSDSRVRRAALLGLEPFESSSSEILPACIKALQDKDTQVRMSAVDIVSRIDKPMAHEAIRTRLRRESRPDVLRVLRRAIERVEASSDE